MIETHGLTMHFGPLTALRDASFHVGQGEILGLLGPNGAGKSTVMKILTTYLRPAAGTATISGFDILKEPLQARRKIGYLPENLPLYPNMETGEYLKFIARARDVHGAQLRQRLDWVVEKTGLESMFYRPIGELSKGYRQRTALAQALIHDPEVIILDEPTTGLDPHQILEIRHLIKELSATKTVLFSTHILQEVEAIAQRVVIINQGSIKALGTIPELATRAGVKTWGLATIKAPGDEIAMALTSANVAAVNVLYAAEGWTRLRFTALDPTAALETLSTLCAAQAWPVRELTLPEPSLEEIFLALTNAEQLGC